MLFRHIQRTSSCNDSNPFQHACISGTNNTSWRYFPHKNKEKEGVVLKYLPIDGANVKKMW